MNIGLYPTLTLKAYVSIIFSAFSFISLSQLYYFFLLTVKFLGAFSIHVVNILIFYPSPELA